MKTTPKNKAKSRGLNSTASRIKISNLAIKAFLMLFASSLLTACFVETEKFKGHAVIVDNFKDKNPLENVYIEIVYTKTEGGDYEFLDGFTSDKNGYFEIDAEYEAGFFCLDCDAYANVYSDTEYTDTLGFFRFQFPANTYAYKTIHLDTFSLSHNIWVIPRIRYLGAYQPDEISIDFYNSDMVDSSQEVMNYPGSLVVNQTFTPVQMVMGLNIQHWLSYGSGHLARGSLMKDSKEIGFGYFKLVDSKHTVEGDTLFLDFYAEKNNL